MRVGVLRLRSRFAKRIRYSAQDDSNVLSRSLVADSRDFREDMQRIGGLVQEIEGIADPAVRAATKGLVQSLMDLHGAALEKALDIVADAGEPGMGIIDRMGRDAPVSSVLILYGLHPEDIETRVVKAVDRVRPQLRKQGCEV